MLVRLIFDLTLLFWHTLIARAAFHVSPEIPLSCRPWTVSWDVQDTLPASLIFATEDTPANGVKFTNLTGNSLTLNMIIPPGPMLAYSNNNIETAFFNGTVQSSGDDSCALRTVDTNVSAAGGNLQLYSDQITNPVGQCQTTNVTWAGFDGFPILGLDTKVDGMDVSIWHVMPLGTLNSSIPGIIQQTGYSVSMKLPFPSGTSYSLVTFEATNLVIISELNASVAIQLGGGLTIAPSSDSSCLLFPEKSLANNPQTPSSNPHTNVKAIIAGSVCAAVVLVFLSIGILYWRRRRVRHRRHTSTILDDGESTHGPGPTQNLAVQPFEMRSLSPFRDPNLDSSASNPHQSSSTSLAQPSSHPEVSREDSRLDVVQDQDVEGGSLTNTRTQIDMPPSYSTIGSIGSKNLRTRREKLVLVQ